MASETLELTKNEIFLCTVKIFSGVGLIRQGNLRSFDVALRNTAFKPRGQFEIWNFVKSNYVQRMDWRGREYLEERLKFLCQLPRKRR